MGAQFTPRAFVERLVLPAVMEPLRAEWDGAKAAAVAEADKGRREEAAALVRAFHARLCTVRVLDPACGTGNFLYVTLELMKQLEGEVLDALAALEGGDAGRLDMAGATVDPHQFLGLDVNPRAVPVAELVLWIGYLQWHFRTHGDVPPAEPILRDFRTIEAGTRLLDYERADPVQRQGGQPGHALGRAHEAAPDHGREGAGRDGPGAGAAARGREAGGVAGGGVHRGQPAVRGGQGSAGGAGRRLRGGALGGVPEGAASPRTSRCSSGGRRPGSRRRARCGASGSSRATASARSSAARCSRTRWQRASRCISCSLSRITRGRRAQGTAAVRIAMTVAERGPGEGRLLAVTHEDRAEVPNVELAERRGIINADLTVGATPADAKPLRANERIASPGVKLHGAGFIVSPAVAAGWGWARWLGWTRTSAPT